jgi:asparagine synthase (glutamine-hydrolysing)
VSGIAGIVLARPDRSPDQAVLDAMLDRLARRGPDETGSVIRGPAALGIRRLRTVDLDAGRQPVTGEDGRTWVVVDGEIYNYRERSNRLAASGHVIRTRSDAEPIVHTWEVRGRDGLEDLEGVFGLAVWQEPSETLVLARDRVGVKPLYYAVLPDQLVFASELRALLAHPGISRELDLDALAAYLVHGWVPAPESILRSVRKLPPAHRLVYAGGEAKVERWWDVRYGAGPKDLLVGSAHLGAALDLAVRQQLRADVPVGILLSAGVDSAALAAIARTYLPGRVETFTLGFEDAAYDESAVARGVAEALGTEHHEHVVGARAALDAFDDLGDLVDEPLGDASLLPTALLSRFARRSVAVALSGLGADEVFAGHEIYRAHRAARVRQRLGFTRPLHDIERHARWLAPCSPGDVGELLTTDALARLSAPPSYEASYRAAEGAADAAWLNRLLYVDLKGHLAEGALQALDRASMASSLQVRVPLLDRRVVEAAAILKPRLKLGALRSKSILRRTLRGRLPGAILARRPKRLELPLAQWFRGELGTRLRDACATTAVAGDALFRRAAVERRLDAHREGRGDHTGALYALLVFLEWAHRHRAA